MFSFWQAKQPISLTGALRHPLIWLTSSYKDIIYVNKNFSSSDTREGIAIYCIHGTADRPAAFALVAERLLENLPAAISSIHLVAFDKRGCGEKIESFAEQLINKIESNQHKQVVLMGHSRGGLVAAYASEYLAEKKGIHVHAVIAVCSPFAGSDSALPPLIWISESVKEMQRDSPFLKDLSQKIGQSKNKYYYFGATNDSLVVGASAAPEVDKAIILDRHGHLSILSSHRLVEYIRTYLAEIAEQFQPSEENRFQIK